jgi:hypothetical protein
MVGNLIYCAPYIWEVLSEGWYERWLLSCYEYLCKKGTTLLRIDRSFREDIDKCLPMTGSSRAGRVSFASKLKPTQVRYIRPLRGLPG